ncbi:bacteriohemerythrin [Geomesophilobacter sediminis]|uniref:Hemerythrin family protein n=1 Tax=Geomesophilobacter sediminis TaxID=2798584 RepID=A0A8J7M0D0_9BACT|nr:bacteriohemerythrin [Geomesophilobacter sediminis]MBJ6724542.1 hemerythrin family protein [Geomesophilobacter sediminis]
MALIMWTSALSVKVKKFDDQHKKLVDMVNDLHEAMKVGKGKEVMGKVLDNLIQYTATHFKDEELLMKQHNFPDFDRHKKEHDQLVSQVLAVQKQFHSSSLPISSSVMEFLKNWLAKHIQGDDAKYGPFFNSKGIV